MNSKKIPARDAISFVVWIIGFFTDGITKDVSCGSLSTGRTPGAPVGMGFPNNQLSANGQRLPPS